MTSNGLTCAEGLFRRLFAMALVAAVLGVVAPPAAARELASVRQRPQTMPFVTPDNKIAKRVVNFYMTVTKESVREVCSRQAEIKSIFLVNAYNRQLAEAKWRFDITSVRLKVK